MLADVATSLTRFCRNGWYPTSWVRRHFRVVRCSAGRRGSGCRPARGCTAERAADNPRAVYPTEVKVCARKYRLLSWCVVTYHSWSTASCRQRWARTKNLDVVQPARRWPLPSICVPLEPTGYIQDQLVCQPSDCSSSNLCNTKGVERGSNRPSACPGTTRTQPQTGGSLPALGRFARERQKFGPSTTSKAILAPRRRDIYDIGYDATE